MSIGIITTAIILIVGYVIITRVIGLAFRFLVPLVLIAVLAGAGVFSGLMPNGPERHTPYSQAQHRSGDDAGGLGDLRLRDVADMAVAAVRDFLLGGLALLNRIADQEPPGQARSLEEDARLPRARPPEEPSDLYDDQRPRDWRSRSEQTY
ncbi:hypothetical protein [Microvirga aerophila]|uniref:hypothetical protein n=1 Tax=Microvirga aerophila TaxID=670291 RepID=UPI000DF01526|nr:hypothetical protein [Microvirga aerophila]